MLVPPPCAEGARGWVDTTSALQAKLATANDKNATASNANVSVIASERSERGNLQETLAQRIDCHANANANSSNDESFHAFANAKDTHPQTPSAREGALGKANSAVCHTEGEARSISKDSISCHTERSEVSKNANANVQNPLDISVSAKPQYDNPFVIASEQSERGNL